MKLGARGKVKGGEGVVSRLECVTMNILAYHFAIPDTHTHMEERPEQCSLYRWQAIRHIVFGWAQFSDTAFDGRGNSSKINFPTDGGSISDRSASGSRLLKGIFLGKG